MSNIEPKKKQIARLIRLLASNLEGEQLAAVNALKRVLDNVGATFNDLGDTIEYGNSSGGSTITQEDLRNFYEAGIQDGLKKAEDHKFSNGKIFVDTNTGPDWKVMANYLLDKLDSLKSNKERGFVTDMYSRSILRDYYPTEKQIAWLMSIFFREGGKV